MWRDCPFSQRNKATKRAVRVEVGGKGGEGEGLDKIWKKGTRKYWGLYKIGGLGTFCQVWIRNSINLRGVLR